MLETQAGTPILGPGGSRVKPDVHSALEPYGNRRIRRSWGVRSPPSIRNDARRRMRGSWIPRVPTERVARSFYNVSTRRLHSALGYRSPANFEKLNSGEIEEMRPERGEPAAQENDALLRSIGGDRAAEALRASSTNSPRKARLLRRGRSLPLDQLTISLMPPIGGGGREETGIASEPPSTPKTNRP